LILAAPIAALAMVGAACSGSADSSGRVTQPVVTSTAPSSPTTLETTTTTRTTTTTITTTTTTLAPPEPLVLDDRGVAANGQTHGVVITDSGWVLPVLGGIDNGWRVWTPCAREADITAGRYIGAVDVVIDPGHGGPTEPGASAPDGTTEASLNLQIAKSTATALETMGYSVVLTRSSDVRVPIATRAEIARALDPKAFISIHLNAGISARSDTPGTELYYQVADPESRRLGGLIYAETTRVLGAHGLGWVSMSDAGAMSRPNRQGTDYYGVLRRPVPVVSVLAELAYISNRAEADLMSTPFVQNEVAAAIARAFDTWVGSNDPGSGFTADPIFRGYGPSGAGFTTNCTDPVFG